MNAAGNDEISIDGQHPVLFLNGQYDVETSMNDEKKVLFPMTRKSTIILFHLWMSLLYYLRRDLTNSIKFLLSKDLYKLKKNILFSSCWHCQNVKRKVCSKRSWNSRKNNTVRWCGSTICFKKKPFVISPFMPLLHAIQTCRRMKNVQHGETGRFWPIMANEVFGIVKVCHACNKIGQPTFISEKFPFFLQKSMTFVLIDILGTLSNTSTEIGLI